MILVQDYITITVRGRAVVQMDAIGNGCDLVIPILYLRCVTRSVNVATKLNHCIILVLIVTSDEDNQPGKRCYLKRCFDGRVWLSSCVT